MTTRGAPSNEWIARQMFTALRTIAGDREAPSAEGRAGHEIARSALDEVRAAFERVTEAQRNADRVNRVFEAIDKEESQLALSRASRVDAVVEQIAVPMEGWAPGQTVSTGNAIFPAPHAGEWADAVGADDACGACGHRWHHGVCDGVGPACPPGRDGPVDVFERCLCVRARLR